MLKSSKNLKEPYFMIKKEFFLFRHGQTQWNLEKKCQGHTDIPLNEKGLQEAEEMAIKFKEINLEVIYSSDLKRAIQTAEALAKKKEIPLFTTNGLREFCLGEAEGRAHADLIQCYGTELWENFLSINCEKDNISYPGGETRKNVLDRTIHSLETISKETKYNVIGIATHGGTLRNLLSHLGPELDPHLKTPNCSVFKLDYLVQDNKWEYRGRLF
jgi:broad specificity phosphatase PhoE